MPKTSTRTHSRSAQAGTRPLPDVLAFMQLLWAVVHRLDATSKRMRRHVGVTGPQRLALRVIGLFPRLSPGDLAAILHVHPSTLTGVLQRLTARRLITRVPDALDRRRAILQLTAKGCKANAARAGTVEAGVALTLAAADVEDVAATARVLGLLATHLDSQTGAPTQRRTRGRTGASASRAIPHP